MRKIKFNSMKIQPFKCYFSISITKFLFTLLLLIVFSPTKQSWIYVHLDGYYTSLLEESIDKVKEEVKEPFIESCNFLYFSNIIPLINQLEATHERTLSNMKNEIISVIELIEKEFYEVIEAAITIVNEYELTSNANSDSKIIIKVEENSSFKLKKLEEDFFVEISRILNIVDERLKGLSCKNEYLVSKTKTEINKVIPEMYDPKEYCRITLNSDYPGIKNKFKSEMSMEELYMYRKCLLTKNLTPESNTTTIAAAYREIELIAGDMRCLSVALGAISNEKFYIREIGNSFIVLNALENTGSTYITDEMEKVELGLFNNDLQYIYVEDGPIIMDSGKNNFCYWIMFTKFNLILYILLFL